MKRTSGVVGYTIKYFEGFFSKYTGSFVPELSIDDYVTYAYTFMHVGYHRAIT